MINALRRPVLSLAMVALVAMLLPVATVGAGVRAATGTLNVAIVRISFSNAAASPATASQLGKAFFDTAAHSVAAYYAQASYGRLALAGRVVGTYRIADTNAGCTWDPRGLGADSVQHWAALAGGMALAAGVDLRAYDKVVYAWARTATCGWGGLAMPAGRDLYLNLTPAAWDPANAGYNGNWHVAAHELGHSLGAHHAGSVACTSTAGVRTALSGTCSVAGAARETGDLMDLMIGYTASATAVTRLPSAFHRGQMGFLLAGEQRTVAGSGAYDVTLNPSDFAASAVKSVRVVRHAPLANPWDAPTAATYASLYLEWRAPFGRFDNFAAADAAVWGLTVRLGDEVRGVYVHPSRLVDTTPATASSADAPLAVGGSFTDGYTGIRITVLSRRLDAAVPANSTMVVRVVIP